MSNSLRPHGDHDPIDHQAPLSMGFPMQKYWRGLAIFSSRGSSSPRDQTRVSCGPCIDRQIVYHWATSDTLYWLYSGHKVCYSRLPALTHGSCVFMKLCIEKNWATLWEIVLCDPGWVLSMARPIWMTIHVLILPNSGLQQPRHGLLKP